MKQRLINSFIMISFFASFAYSQSDWESWNERYKEINVTNLLSAEELYADSVNKGLIQGMYYLRMDTYRFSAIFTGEKREIVDTIKASMKRVYKVQGNPDFLSIIDKIKYDYQFNIGGEKYWLAVQPNLEKPIKKELKKDDNVYLYCLFLNEHTFKGILYNTFLISEFYKN